MTLRLSRRALLIGAGGVAIGLPALDAMIECGGERGRARADLAPTRYCLMVAGQAIGGDRWANDEFVIDGERRQEAGHYIVPSAYGTGWEITTPLAPLQALRDRFNLVSNMRIPYSTTSKDPNDVPDGGAFRDFHGGGKGPLLCGTRSVEAHFTCRSITSDQVIANMHQGATTQPSLVYRAQPAWYLSGSEFAGREFISYRGDHDPIDAQSSPSVAFDALFRGFTPDDAAGAARADFDRRARRSVLDVVLGRRDRLLSRLGAADRVRIERWFDEIRALELRVAAVPPIDQGGCQLPTAPGADPGVGGVNAGSGTGGMTPIQPGTGYSGETERSEAFVDLIAMAFACDLTRAATLQITCFQSHMNIIPVSEAMGTRFSADLHELGHGGDTRNLGQLPVSLMLKWHIGFYARLMQRLSEIPEGDATVLDNSVLVFAPEAGHGTQLNDAIEPNATHSVERMVMLVGGGGSGRLNGGLHIDADGGHPAQCLVTAMQAAGHDGDRLGEVTGTIDGLLA